MEFLGTGNADPSGEEQELLRLLERCSHIPGTLMELGALSSGSAEVAYDDYPTTALLKLQHWLNLQFEAICWLLTASDFESVAYGLSRGLLEGWAHLWWVRGSDEAGRRCRALRLDQMLAREELESVLGIDDDETVAPRRARVEHLDRLAMQFGCSGPHRKLKGVATSLREIQRVAKIDWPLLMWRQTSLLAHQVGFSWLVEDAGGRNAFRKPTVTDRAGRLLIAITIFQNCGALFLEITGASARLPAWQKLYHDLLAVDLLQEAQKEPSTRGG